MIKSSKMLTPDLMVRAKDAMRRQGQASESSGDKGQGMVGQAFEGMLVRHMVRSLRKTVPNSGLFSQNSSQGIYDHFIENALVEQLSEGGGLGVAQLVGNETRVDRHSGAPLTTTALNNEPGKRAVGRQGDNMGHESVLRTGTLASNLPPQDDVWLDSPEAELQLRELLRIGKPSTK